MEGTRLSMKTEINKIHHMGHVVHDMKTIPGEAFTSSPGFAGYAVKVRDLAITRRHLESNGFPVVETARGDIFVPSASLLGTALIFTQR